MKDIEVGEYVRTKEGEIHKVIKIIEDDGDWDYYCYGNNAGYFAMDIANHSKHLIDLIEVGDYVNGKEVIEIIEINEKIYLITDYCPQNYIKTDIKTILTKEQFDANCYKVGGEDDEV